MTLTTDTIVNSAKMITIITALIILIHRLFISPLHQGTREGPLRAFTR